MLHLTLSCVLTLTEMVPSLFKPREIRGFIQGNAFGHFYRMIGLTADNSNGLANDRIANDGLANSLLHHITSATAVWLAESSHG